MITKRELNALNQIANWNSKIIPFMWMPRSMEKLAQHGWVEEMPGGTPTQKHWRITDLGRRKYEAEFLGRAA